MTVPGPGEDPADLLRRAMPVIVHDLNNLRAIVQGNLRLARGSAGAGRWNEVAEPLADVDLAFQHLAAMTLGLAALAGPAPAAAPAPCALRPVLARLETLLRWALPPPFTTGVRAPAEETRVAADPELLLAALLKLALCARDAAPGGGAVEISVASAPPGGAGRAQVRVEITRPAPAAEAAGASPAREKAALRYAFALALARRAAGPAGDVLCGDPAGEQVSVCLLLPLANPDGV